MKREDESRIARPSEGEARALVDQARRMRAETLGRVLRSGWSRIAASRPVSRPAAAMAPARA